jgi:hypothetical protein
MAYAETTEEWAEAETSDRDPDCPTTAEYDADPSKYIWIRPFGNQFRVYTYDTEAKDGYEVVTICDAPTMAEAEQARTDYIAKIKPTIIGIASGDSVALSKQQKRKHHP